MFRLIFMLLLSATSTCAGDSTEPGIQSPEQAVLHFRLVRDAELKGSFKSLDHADALSVRRCRPREFQPPAQDPVFGDTDTSRFFGNFAAVVSNKSDTWILTYDLGMTGGMAFCLASDTGKILYAYHISEG